MDWFVAERRKAKGCAEDETQGREVLGSALRCCDRLTGT